MKSAFLLTAMLSGLCAEVMASPLDNIAWDNSAAPVIEPDLRFIAASPDEADPGYDPQELVTTDFDQNAIDEDQFALGADQVSGSVGVPEPPPVALILVGLSFLGGFALWRRTRWERLRRRRRTAVQMRAIIIAER